ncbi:MAG: hypothetical protein H7312_03065 [Tardiphaga sp.]|nr:hypothetical protein [Tardiphaga sp.]
MPNRADEIHEIGIVRPRYRPDSRVSIRMAHRSRHWTKPAKIIRTKEEHISTDIMPSFIAQMNAGAWPDDIRGTNMDLQARIELWKSIDPDPAFCRKAERDMLMLSSSDENWVSERMRDFERALDQKITE